jgi:hypothetical protein
MEKQKVRHHYVPKFFLREFCTDNQIFVFDKQKKQRHYSNPESIGFEKYLYTLYSDEFDCDAIEDYFSEIEGNVAPIIKEIIESNELPIGDKFEKLLYFVACMSARNPEIIGNYKDFLEKIIRYTSLLVTENKYEEFC